MPRDCGMWAFGFRVAWNLQAELTGGHATAWAVAHDTDSADSCWQLTRGLDLLLRYCIHISIGGVVDILLLL